jgi:hypothetical protein
MLCNDILGSYLRSYVYGGNIVSTMTNSSEDFLRAPSPNPNVNPISKVGSMLNTTMQGLVTFVREIVQPLVQKSSAEAKNLTLPRFTLEIASADPAAWCSTVYRTMKRNPLQGDELFPALSSTLEGSAGSWFTQMQTNKDVTWPQFKKLFTTRYGGGKTTASALMKAVREPPLKDETPGAYGMRLNSLLKARWQRLTK